MRRLNMNFSDFHVRVVPGEMNIEIKNKIIINKHKIKKIINYLKIIIFVIINLINNNNY
jgi:hypothetical protein